ncbi:MAG TPA: hypothetical protein VM925_10540 [Labilithrix sp.]|nr:hypothetical protein [Labilithrix sp.]
MTPDDLSRAMWEAGRAELAPAEAKARAAARVSSAVASGSAITIKIAIVSTMAVTLAAGAGAWMLHEAGRERRARPVVEANASEESPMPAERSAPTPTMEKKTPALSGLEGDAKRRTTAAGHEAPSCETVSVREGPPQLCSVPGRPVRMEVVNGCASEAVDLFWVDYGCKEIFYKRLEPGATFEQSTFDTHPWRIRSAQSHKLLRDVSPAETSSPWETSIDGGTECLQLSNERWSDEPQRLVSIRSRPAADRTLSSECAKEGNRILLEMVNETSRPVEVLWLDYKCEEKSYGRLSPGERRIQKTFDSHTWRFREVASGALVNEYAPPPSTIQDDRIFVYVP